MDTRNRRLGPWDSLGAIIDAIDGLENTNVKCTWFESVASGLSGTITPPTGGTILLDEWAAGVDVLVSKIDTGVPTFEPVLDDEGSVITGTLNAAGNWTISGTPEGGYPISLIYVYRVALENFDSVSCLSAAQLEGINTLSFLGDLANELTGFPDDYRDESVIALDGLSFTITPVGDKFSVWVLGNEFVYTSAETQVLDGTEGIHWVYFDSDGAIQVVINPSEDAEENLIKRNALIASILLDDNNTGIIFGDERHGLTMDGATHFYLHEINGFSYYEGLTAGDIVADGSGNENASATLSLTDGTLFDEDLKYKISDSGQTLSNPAQIPVYYMDGVSGSWRKDTADDYPVKNYPTDDQLLAYNSFDSPNYEQSEAGNQTYVLCHIFATNDIDEPIIAIQGQAEYATIILARAGATTEMLNLNTIGLPAQEFTPLYSIIYQTATAYSNDVQARIRTTDDGDDYIDWRTAAVSGGSGGGGAGDVTGPGGGVADNEMVLFDGGTGKVIKGSGITAVSGVIAGTALELTTPIISTILTATGKTGAVFNNDGPVDLYWNEILCASTHNNGSDGYGMAFGTDGGVRIYKDVSTAAGYFHNEINSAQQYITGRTSTGTFATILLGDPDGELELYFANSQKFVTSATGATINGVLISDGLTLGQDEYLELGSAGHIYGSATSVVISYVSDLMATFTHEAAVELYYNSAKTVETTDRGIHIGTSGAIGPGEVNIEGTTQAACQLFDSGGSEDKKWGRIIQRNDVFVIDWVADDFLSSTKMAAFNPGGAVEIYHAGVKAFESMTEGISIDDVSNATMDLYFSGSTFEMRNMNAAGKVQIRATTTADGNVKILDGNPDGETLLYYTGLKSAATQINGLGIYDTTGTDTFLQFFNSSAGSQGYFQFRSTYCELIGVNTQVFKAVDGGALELYFNGVKKFETAVDGVYFTDDGDDGLKVQVYGSNGVNLSVVGDSNLFTFTGMQDTSDEVWLAQFDPDGPVKLYNNGVLVFEISDIGFDFGPTGDEASFYNAASTTYLQNNVPGDVFRILLRQGDDLGYNRVFNGDPDGATELYYAGAKKLETTGGGVYVTSHGDDGLDIEVYGSDNVNLKVIGTSNTLTMTAFNSTPEEVLLTLMDPDGAVELYFAGVKRFETAANGSILIYDTDGSEYAYIQKGSNWFSIVNGTTAGHLRLQSHNVSAAIKDLIVCDPDAGVGLYYMGIVKATTIDDGFKLNTGILTMAETTQPVADVNNGKLYCKNDNKLYFQDGAGVQHTVAFV